MKRIFCAVCISLISLQVLAGEIDDSLQKLDAALQKSAKEQPKTPEGADPRRANFSVMLMPRLRECIAGKDINSARETLQQLSAYPLSPEALKASEELLIALRKDQEAQEKIAAEQIDKALKHASETVKNAKSAADLDPILVELSSLKSRPDNRRYSDRMQADRNKVESAYRFVARWQEYLIAQAAGNMENCRNILRELTNSEILLLPRSELLAKAQEPAVVNGGAQKLPPPIEEVADELIAKIKSLEEVGAASKELRRISNQLSANSFKIGPYIQNLEQIDRTYREFQAGLGTSIDVVTNSCPTPASIIPLKNQLLLLVLPRYIGAPADIKPKAGEGVLDFLNRVAAESKARGDLQLSSRARETLRQLQHTSSWSSNDTSTVAKFQAAQNQEIAGQYMLAVISYQEALKTGSEAIPAKLIGERLAEIKKNHPEDFEKGMERFLNPPPIQYSMPRFPMGMPGIPGRPEPTPTPTPEPPKLVIPPATPTPTVAPSPTPQPSPAK